jgi:hypothetical protein
MRIAPPYSAEDLLSIAGVLKLKELPIETVQRLQAAAFDYDVALCIGDEPGLAERRWALEQIIELSRKLEAPLGGLDSETAELLEAERIANELGRLHRIAKAEFAKLSPASRPENIARRHFVDALITEFVHLTAKQPPLTYGSGPLYRFVIAAITPIERKRQASPDWKPSGIPDLLDERVRLVRGREPKRRKPRQYGRKR